MEHTQTTLAYLAGFFDGEGSIYILKKVTTDKSTLKQTVRYGLEISFTSSVIEPLLIAQEVFGGGITTTPAAPKRRVVYRLRLRTSAAGIALSALRPYLIIKKERADLALEFQGKISTAFVGKGRKRLDVDVCEDYKRRITQLNDKVWNKPE